MTYYEEIDKGQVYNDSVILGLALNKTIFLSNLIMQQESIFSYIYTKDERFLDNFIRDLYSERKQSNYDFSILYTKKELNSTDLYRLTVKHKTNFIVDKQSGFISEERINKYLLKLKMLGKLNECDVYSKKELRTAIKVYVETHKNEMKSLLRDFKYKFICDFGVSDKDAKKLGDCTYVNNIYKSIILIKKDNQYGFIDSSKLLISLNLIQMNVKVNTNGVITKAPYYLETSIENVFLLPNDFRVIKDMNDVKEVFDNFVRSFMY